MQRSHPRLTCHCLFHRTTKLIKIVVHCVRNSSSLMTYREYRSKFHHIISANAAFIVFPLMCYIDSLISIWHSIPLPIMLILPGNISGFSHSVFGLKRLHFYVFVVQSYCIRNTWLDILSLDERGPNVIGLWHFHYVRAMGGRVKML